MKPGDLVIILNTLDDVSFGVPDDIPRRTVSIPRGETALVIGIDTNPHVQLLVDGMALWVPIRFVSPA